LDIKLRTEFTNYRDTSKQSLNNFYLNPSYTLHLNDRMKVKLGVNLTSNEDNFNFYPDLEVSAVVVPGVATAFIGTDGTIQRNSLRTLADFNPWIKPRLRIRNSEYNRVFGGLSGTAYGVGYRAEVSYKNVKNMALFLLDHSNELPKFDVLYDTTTVITIQGTVTVPLIKNLDVSGTVAQNIYSMENEEKPWHLPSFTLNTAAIYTMPDQGLQVRADLFLQNGVPYRTLDGTAENLNALFDLSLSGEYSLSDNIGIWLQLNNLANNKRQQFAQYPTIGINILGGASIRF
jgi:hypothetical protein